MYDILKQRNNVRQSEALTQCTIIRRKETMYDNLKQRDNVRQSEALTQCTII